MLSSKAIVDGYSRHLFAGAMFIFSSDNCFIIIWLLHLATVLSESCAREEFLVYGEEVRERGDGYSASELDENGVGRNAVQPRKVFQDPTNAQFALASQSYSESRLLSAMQPWNSLTYQPHLLHQRFRTPSNLTSAAQPFASNPPCRTPIPPSTGQLTHPTPQNSLTPPQLSSCSSASMSSLSSSAAYPLLSCTGNILPSSEPQSYSRFDKFDSPTGMYQLVPGPCTIKRDDPRISTVAIGVSVAPSPAASAVDCHCTASDAHGILDGYSTNTSPACRLLLAAAEPLKMRILSSPYPATAEYLPHARMQGQNQTQQHTRIPNVYINGLPPNFPEDQLYAITREFGTVLSVRTFTRYGIDKLSGYGFVLLDSIDAAEKCIETLGKYRRLYPSFCKLWASLSIILSSSIWPSLPSLPRLTASTALTHLSPSDLQRIHYIPNMNTPGTHAPDSYKVQSTQDLSSTNLYMQDLPLSTDETDLAVLVRPYRIISSRIFRTRLSNPPGIIAFARLETRAAAKEIIERLDGRMVYDEHATPHRIQVRFADTNEQRKLKRAQYFIGREPSLAPFTLSQAANVNLKHSHFNPFLPQFLQSGLDLDMNASPCLMSDRHLVARGKSVIPPLLHESGMRQRQQLFARADNNLPELVTVPDPNDALGNHAAYATRALHDMQNLPYADSHLFDAEAHMQTAMSINMSNPFRAHNHFKRVEGPIVREHVQQQQAQLAQHAVQERPCRPSNLMACSNVSQDDFMVSTVGAHHYVATDFTRPRHVGRHRNGLNFGLKNDFKQVHFPLYNVVILQLLLITAAVASKVTGSARRHFSSHWEGLEKDNSQRLSPCKYLVMARRIQAREATFSTSG
ncbi:hypothetical protein BKA93DRAFT_752487 [Sparassis latifolia]